jgi:hypothetical protein
MQLPEISDLSKRQPRSRDAVHLPGKPGTIPVTVRLDPPRYDRLKQLVQRLQTTGQSIIQTALDRSMVTLERQRAPRPEIEGQSTLFMTENTEGAPKRPRQDSFAFIRPEPTIALTYRASVPMHRWMHRSAAERGITIQELITEALRAARGQD